MKLRYFTIAFFLSSLIIAQGDSIYVTVDGNFTTIWHTETLRNCASLYDMNVHLSDSVITVMEVDTVGSIVDCLCYFDLAVSIGSLFPGDYTLDVFSLERMSIEDLGDTLYWGSTGFTITGQDYIPSPTIITHYQSSCKNITGLDGPESADAFQINQNYPNPFNSSTSIKFTIPTEQGKEHHSS